MRPDALEGDTAAVNVTALPNIEGLAELVRVRVVGPAQRRDGAMANTETANLAEFTTLKLNTRGLQRVEVE